MTGLGRTACLAVVVSLVALPLLAVGDPPPAPEHYFNDYAGFVAKGDADRLDDKLRQFDETSSTQIVVAIFRELPSPSLDDFTIHTAQAWRVGRKKLDNGAVFFVFVKERKMRIEVGYGLEGALTDLRSKQILDDVVTPRLRSGDPAGGLEAGIDAMIAATRGEYQANPARETHRLPVGLLIVVLIAVLLLVWLQGGFGPMNYTGRGWRGGGWGGGGWGGMGGGGGGGGWGGGGGDSGGGFSGGGGSFGGGGASGSW